MIIMLSSACTSLFLSKTLWMLQHTHEGGLVGWMMLVVGETRKQYLGFDCIILVSHRRGDNYASNPKVHVLDRQTIYSNEIFMENV